MDAAATNLRTFIAIDLSAAVRRTLYAYQAQLQRELAAVDASTVFRWSAPDNIHLTLRFLGDTTSAQCEVIAARLQEAAAAWTPFTLEVGELGGFPNLRRPRVLWLGVRGEMAPLAQMQAAVEAIVVGAGFESEPKAFRPHLTLARTRRAVPARAVQAAGTVLDVQAADAQDAEAADVARTFVVSELIHYRSELQRGGSVYTPLSVIPLGAA